jgi:hypothetical protein
MSDEAEKPRKIQTLVPGVSWQYIWSELLRVHLITDGLPKPECLVHNVDMDLKKGPNGFFWACPRYESENCKQTLSLSPRLRKVQQQLRAKFE